MTTGTILDAPQPLYYPAFACGCRPYLEAFTYDAWRQYGSQVKRGERAHHIPDVRDRLFCQCQVKSQQARATTVAVLERPNLESVAVPVESEPVEEPRMSEAEVDLYEAASRVREEQEEDLLDSMLERRSMGTPVTSQPQPAPSMPKGAVPISELMRQLGATR